jgi:hypothetical protein
MVGERIVSEIDGNLSEGIGPVHTQEPAVRDSVKNVGRGQLAQIGQRLLVECAQVPGAHKEQPADDPVQDCSARQYGPQKPR